MTNKHEWVGTSGLKQLLLMLVGFIYLLWQWQVMQRIKGSATAASKREQERESGILSEWTRGFCLPGTSEDNIALHQCHRSHRRNHVYREGTTTGKQEETQSMQCNNMMHDNDMAICWCFELMQLATSYMGLVWTQDSNLNSICDYSNAIYFICPKQ